MIAKLGIFRRACASEEGFTLIEVLVAALMLVLVVSAATVLFADGTDTAVASQRQSQLISVADQQIEMIRQEVKTEGFNELAMNATPSALPSAYAYTSYSSTIDTDPNSFVVAKSGCGGSSEEYKIEANYDNTSEGQPVDPQNTAQNASLPWSNCDSGAEPLEIIPSTSLAFITPQQTVTVGTDTAIVDTYVTDTYVGCNSNFSGCPVTTGGSIACASASFPTVTTPSSTTCSDARRVIVAVVLNRHGRYNLGPSAPVYVSTVFTNPTPSNTPTNSIGINIGVQLG